MTDDHFLGQYHLLERIGRGGMAEVYRAREQTSNREVAIKIIRTELTDDPTLSRRFLREVRALSRLAHPHILSPITWGEADGIFYLVMPWVRDGTLARFLAARGGALPLEEALPLFGQLCQAVQHAHKSGIIHRDIKPQNVLMQRGTHLLLADFGVALDCTETRLTFTGAGPGSAIYMAPEQAIGRATTRSDVYSLGIVLYQMLTGALPFSGATPFEVLLKHQLAPVPDPRQFQPDLPAAVVHALYSALEKEPGARCASPQALWEALQQVSGTVPIWTAPIDVSGAYSAHPLMTDERQDWSAWPGGQTTLPLSQTAFFQRQRLPSRRRKGLVGGVIAGGMLLLLALFASAHLGISPAGLTLRAAPSTKATRLSGPTTTPAPPPHNAVPVEPTPTPPRSGGNQSQPGSAGQNGGGQNGDQDGQNGSPGHGKGHGGDSGGEDGHGKGGH
jgi:serine/threonine protein kinase